MYAPPESGVVNRGTVVSVRGSVITARFAEQLPVIDSKVVAGDDGAIIAEVVAVKNGKSGGFLRDKGPR